MSLIEKQTYIKDLESRLGEFVPANELPKILLAAMNTLENYDLTGAPAIGGGKGDSNDMIKYFLDAKRVEGRSEKTIERYRYVLNRLQNDTGVPLPKMTIIHIRAYYSAEQDRGISPTTINGMRQIHSYFYSWCKDEGLIDRNPMVNFTSIKEPEVIRKPFTDVELARLDDACVQMTKTENSMLAYRARALIAFLASTGCRISEALSVDRDDIDWHSQSLTVTGKGNKQRQVYLDDVAAMKIKAYLELRNDQEPALFTTASAARLKPGGARKSLKWIGGIAGVENVHPHRFRRTRATSLINAGMPIQEVKTMLGHTKLDTTMMYVYVDGQSVQNSFRRFS